MSATTGGVRQWLRKISLIAEEVGSDGIELSALRVVFEVEAATVDMPQTLRAKIYNLSKGTAQKLTSMKTVPAGQGVGSSAAGRSAAKVTLQAGYEGNFGIIFAGDMIQHRTGRESPTDTFVELFCGDGDWAHVWGKINRTLAAGYVPKDINEEQKKVLQKYGMQVGDLPEDVPQTAAPRGKTMYAMAREVRRDLAQTYNLSAYPNQGNLVWLAQSAYRPGDIAEINAGTGMIGMPQQTPYGVSVNMLLNPSIGPGALLRVKNESIQQGQFQTSRGGNFDPNAYLAGSLSKPDSNADGSYKVLGVYHKGDSRGNDWYTRAECIATNPQGASNQKVPPSYGTVWQ